MHVSLTNCGRKMIVDLYVLEGSHFIYRVIWFIGSFTCEKLINSIGSISQLVHWLYLHGKRKQICQASIVLPHAWVDKIIIAAV